MLEPRGRHMNWRTIDLNLLVVFDAVLRTRSASRAASRLNMSQPAVSHALARLRETLRDDLFIRTPDGMAPTPFAERLAGPVRDSLDRLRVALEAGADFAPESAERRFVIALNNHAALVLGAPLAAAAMAHAPGISLDLRPSGTLDLMEHLDRGDLDLAIGAMPSPGERFRDQLLFEDNFVAVMRQGHPACIIGASTTLATLAELPHLILSSTGDGTEFVDAALAAEGLERRIALRAPLLTAASILAQSDMVAVMAARSARVFSRFTPLQILALPFPSPSIVTAMLWHRRFDDLAAHRWLRGIVRAASSASGG
jgi:DNA-binding transcriptional LysR family regulator